MTDSGVGLGRRLDAIDWCHPFSDGDSSWSGRDADEDGEERHSAAAAAAAAACLGDVVVQQL